MKKHMFVLVLALLAVTATAYALIQSIPASDLVRRGDLHLSIPINWNIPHLIWGVALASGAILIEMLPYFAFGVLLGGFLLEFVSRSTLEKYMGRGGVGSIFIATLAGALVPICSCGIVPVLAGLVQSGLPLAPIVAFLVSAPMMNPATMMMTIGMLGVNIAIARVIAIFAISVATGLAVRRLLSIGWLKNPVKLYVKPKLSPQMEQLALRIGVHLANNPGGLSAAELSEMLGTNIEDQLIEFGRLNLLSHHNGKWRLTERDMSAHRNGCFVLVDNNTSVGSPTERTIRAFSYAWDSFIGLSKYVTIGILIAGAIKVFLPTNLITGLLGGITINSVIVAALIAIPLYVCTCSDVPMVDALLTKGMGGGAALAFLLGGPGLSIPSLIMLSGVFKRKLLLVYAAISFVGCVIAGYVFNLFQ